MKVQIIKKDKKRFSQLGAVGDKVAELTHFLKKGRRFASDARPWYVVIGEDTATQSWINSLGLKPAWQSVGGSKKAAAEDVSIRAMDDLVLFSATNSFWQQAAEDGERSPWQSFCHLLNKERSYKAPHGLVVCVSLLSLQDQEQFSEFEAKLKLALNEAAEIYFGKIPVYLVLTDLDQVEGFQAYAAKIRPEQKEQVFGFSHPFSKKNTLNEPEALKAIHAQLETKLVAQLRYDEKKGDNVDAFFFPQHLAAFYPAITELCEHITHASPNVHRLILRGVYFTAFENQPAKQGGAEAIFAKPILNEVLLKETQAFSTWHQVDEWLSQHRKGLLVGVSAGTIALLSIWWLGVLHDEAYLNQVNTAVVGMQSIADPLNQLIALQQLYDMGEDQDTWMVRFLGVLFPSKVANIAQHQYAEALQNNFEPLMANSLATGLAASLQNAKTSGISDMALLNQDANIYNWLAAYLMLNELNHFDSHTVNNMLELAWQGDPQQAEKMSLYADLVQFGLIQQTINQDLVAQARGILGNQPIDIRAFFALKANATVSPVLLGGAKQNVLNFTTGSSIDGFYTLDASKQFLGSNEESAIKQTLEQSWVLGDAASVKVNDAAIASLETSVNQFYWSQYFTTWHDTLAGLSFKSFNGLSNAAGFLKNANQSNSAFASLWQEMTNNLTGIDSTNIPSDPKLGQFANSMNTYLSNQTNFNNITNALTELGQTFSSAESGDGAIDLSVKILNQQVDTLNQLQQLANQAPEPIQNILNSLIQQLVAAVFSQAEAGLEQDWLHAVADQCRRVVGDSSSFVGASNANVGLDAFANFFGDQGVGGQFINQHLANLVSIQNGIVHSRSAYGVTFSLPGHLQENIVRLLLIRSAFFNNSDSSPGFRLQLTPLFLSKNVADFTVTDAGQSLFYQNGPRISQTLTWPNNSNSVTVKFDGLNGQTWQGTYPGQWGLIKFLNSANITVIDATHYQLTFTEQGFSATYEASLESGNLAGVLALKDFRCN